MAEAEDVLTDVARHATVYLQGLWRRQRSPPTPPRLDLAEVAARLDLLAEAVFARRFRLRPAQAPAPRTWLDKLIRRDEAAPPLHALPATDGASIWLPRSIATGGDADGALARYRLLLLQQAMRAARGSASHYPFGQDGALQAFYHVLEARAADDALALLLPGMQPALQGWRRQALAARPQPHTLPARLRPIETMLRAVLARQDSGAAPAPPGAVAVLAQARRLAVASGLQGQAARLLLKDDWLGEFLPAPVLGHAVHGHAREDGASGAAAVRSARLARRPRVRAALEGEDEPAAPGPMMVQTAQPHEQAEDAMGLQRPTDRDTGSAADDFGDSLSELAEARLLWSPGAAREVLLSDDPPDRHANKPAPALASADGERSTYPEWDWRTASYAGPGATVTVCGAAEGEQAVLDAILRRHAAALPGVRRNFELLRAQRTRLRRQLDGDDIDLQGWIDDQAQRMAGGPPEQRLYQAERRARRDLAVTLLVDLSGSTDGWVSGQSRVIDVEREALLMVCVALDGLGEPFSVLGFSGEGPGGVIVRPIKRFGQGYDKRVALRIAGLEPERYTRAGAAVRHASAELMTQAAGHRLLILLSDGRPNDVDQYDGRYGVEDLRQAVTEARLQGISPFCLTIDRQAASYLPAVFGECAYALLPRAQLLPTVLLGWLRKLVVA
ncbi:nitric oxide reductase activation protein NorD [Massilia genomosp. 1]|uniref:VWA domain-containing protein n=1 Tax=Massilia genomosp. 1 TaxID=2609280 RepID=A0ABX0MKX8_9BURK|nr:VWA domain-containing protein [Massilia genomosp. 1]NHZ61255.1 VWA domain-containing protein [Massilia genomosp. 1]